MTTTLPPENVSCTYFGNAFSSSRTFSEASNRWLRLKSRSTSRRRCFAPSASRRARSARLLATSAVTRKANNATQFWGSAMVNVPTGGRKKKLKAAGGRLMNFDIVESFAQMVRDKGIDKDVLGGILEEIFGLLVKKKYGEEAKFDVVVNRS